MIEPAEEDEAAAPAPAEIEPGQLSCYTAALARYLEGWCPDPLAHVARSVRLAVRPGLPGGLIAFSHHWLALNELADGSRLVYRGAADPAAVPVGLDAELRTGLGALAVTYTGSMAWSPADSEVSAPHFLLVREHHGQRWHVEDPFQALMPSGSQQPFTGWLSTAELTEAMTPPSPLRPELRLRKEYVFGFPVPLPPDDHYQWLGHAAVPDSAAVPYPTAALPPGWLTEPAQALRFLRDLWAGTAGPDHLVLARERSFDDIWASARHHTFRYAHLRQFLLDPPDQELVRRAHDLWHDLPMALHFAIASAARGHGRPTLIKMTFDQLIEAETQVADVLQAHGYGPATSPLTYRSGQQAPEGGSSMTEQEFTDSTCGRPALWFSALATQDDGAWANRALVSGNGCYVRDVSGREYLDARCALWSTALGYSNERIRAAITRQLHELTAAQIIRHDQPTKIALDYASRLVSVLPANLRHVRLCTTGAQAAEGAVLLSRFIRIGEGHPERSEVLALWDGYHGIAGLAGSLTGERPLHEALAPMCPGVQHVPAGDIGALRSTVASIGADRLSAVIMEPILGTDVRQLAPGYLREVQDLCHAADIHFILDEVSTGFGRTGGLTVTGQLGLEPDMLLLSKALTSGYAALSAIAVTHDVLERTLRLPTGVFPHGSTADGLPLAVAAASAVLDEFADGSILANVASRGAQLTSAFADRIGRSAIRSVHGPGLMIAVGLADGAGQPLPGPAMQQVKHCLRDVGLLVSISNSFVILTPPLILTAAEADLLIARFDRGLAAALGGEPPHLPVAAQVGSTG